jgi:hypothetical protein
MHAAEGAGRAGARLPKRAAVLLLRRRLRLRLQQLPGAQDPWSQRALVPPITPAAAAALTAAPTRAPPQPEAPAPEAAAPGARTER